MEKISIPCAKLAILLFPTAVADRVPFRHLPVNSSEVCLETPAASDILLKLSIHLFQCIGTYQLVHMILRR